MRARELLGSTVEDAEGARVGVVAELLLSREDGDYRVAGLRVAHGREKNLFGYERPDAAGPWLVRWFFRRLHRGDRVVEWRDVGFVGTGVVKLRDQAP